MARARTHTHTWMERPCIDLDYCCGFPLGWRSHGRLSPPSCVACVCHQIDAGSGSSGKTPQSLAACRSLPVSRAAPRTIFVLIEVKITSIDNKSNDKWLFQGFFKNWHTTVTQNTFTRPRWRPSSLGCTQAVYKVPGWDAFCTCVFWWRKCCSTFHSLKTYFRKTMQIRFYFYFTRKWTRTN